MKPIDFDGLMVLPSSQDITMFAWIALKCGTGIHGVQRMNPNDL